MNALLQHEVTTEFQILTEPDFQDSLSYANELTTYSLLKHANMLAHLLIAKKELPQFYFIDAAAEIGIPPQACRYLKLQTWPINHQRNPRKLRHIAHILTKVYLRILPHPESETFPQAMRRFRDRVAELKEMEISHNRISQHLRISYKTLQDIMENPENLKHRPRHCPWTMLESLEHAEEEIDRSIHYRVNSEAWLKARGEGSEVDIPPNKSKFTKPGSNCHKCNASPVHLYPDGRDASGNLIRTCRICGVDNLSPPDSTVEGCNLSPHNVIERYAPCWSCGGPWHNLTKAGQDSYGYAIYTCILCGDTNRLPPKPPPLKSQSRKTRRAK